MNTKRVRFPIHVKRGSSTIKIYRDRKPNATYYRVVYHLGGKRHRLNFNDLGKAQSEAEAKASQLSRGDIDAMQLSGRDRLEFGRAKDAVKFLELPLDAVALQFAEACKLLCGVPLVDAARFYVRHHGANLKRVPVAEAAREMIQEKQRKGVSKVYLADLRYRLGRFADAFHCDVSAIAPDDVSEFFQRLGLSACSHNNFHRTLRTFFAFSQKRGWLSKETDLLSCVEKRSEKRFPVEVFTPSQLGALLENASPHLAPAIALSAFAGLRSEEILRLEWSDIERRPGFIEVAAHKAKTATRRIVPITGNLARWLAAAPRSCTRVWPHSKDPFFKAMRKAADSAKITWKHNVLRHSFISYRLALVQDVNRVALEAGTSPAMIFRHYRELATPEQAHTWFAIAPSVTPNVIPISVGAE